MTPNEIDNAAQSENAVRQSRPQTSAPRRSYAPPHLLIHGSVAELTAVKGPASPAGSNL